MKSALAGAFVLVPAVAYSMAMATTDQFVCARVSDTVVVARVQDGASVDCRLRSNGVQCTPTELINLSIKISAVIAVGRPEPNYPSGVPIATKTSISTVLGKTLLVTVTARMGHYGAGAQPVISATPLTDADIHRLFVGKNYIFSVSGSTPNVDEIDATMWPVAAKNWVKDTVRRKKGIFCPMLLAK
jgi:hypothetical protein